MSALYLAAGIAHFSASRVYERTIPAGLLAHHALVLISGAAELAGALGLLYPPTRRAAAWGIILLLLAIFPANINMALHPQLFPRIPTWALYARLPVQLALIAWACLYTHPATSPRCINA
ncbi:MAG: DoxX family protein [Acidobacteriota bacterium]